MTWRMFRWVYPIYRARYSPARSFFKAARDALQRSPF